MVEIFAKAAEPVVSELKSLANNKGCIPFGTDNCFPQAIALLNRKSAINRAVIKNKSYYVIGDGLTSDNEATYNKFTAWNINATVKYSAYDFISFGNAYIEVIQLAGQIKFNHIDATKCRLTTDGNGVIVNPDWSARKVKDSKDVVLPLYPTFEKIGGAMRSIVHIKEYEPTFNYYGVPSWVGAMDSAAIAYKTNKWNLSRLDNSFQSSGVLLVDGNISPADAAELKEKFKKEFTGEGNQGKVMFIAQNLGGTANTTWSPITAGNEGDWTQLHKQSTDEIITAHNWYPSLSGIATAGALGNTQQIRNEYQVAINTVISDIQGALLQPLKRVIEVNAKTESESISFINKPPVSIADKIDMNAVTKIWEGRKLAGLDYDPEDVTQQGYIKPQSTQTQTAANG